MVTTIVVVVVVNPVVVNSVTYGEPVGANGSGGIVGLVDDEEVVLGVSGTRCSVFIVVDVLVNTELGGSDTRCSVFVVVDMLVNTELGVSDTRCSVAVVVDMLVNTEGPVVIDDISSVVVFIDNETSVIVASSVTVDVLGW